MRYYPEHEDLGLDPAADRTELLTVKENAPGRCANTAGGLQNSPITQEQES